MIWKQCVFIDVQTCGFRVRRKSIGQWSAGTCMWSFRGGTDRVGETGTGAEGAGEFDYYKGLLLESR